MIATKHKQTSIQPRKTPPTECSHWDDLHSFRVWSCDPAFMEDERPWKCVATFRFLQECLEYISGLQDCGCDVVYQSPAHTGAVLHTDRRMVWRPPLIEG